MIRAKSSGRARTAIALSLVLSSLWGAGAPPPAQELASEQELRAVFLLNFARFITWPAEQPEDRSPIVFSVAGDDSFSSALSKVVNGQTVRGRPLVVQPLKDLRSAATVHVLYFASATGKQISDWLAANPGAATLTVSGDKEFCRMGGMIYLYYEDRHIRFEINQQSLQQSGLRASSRLLALAKLAGGAR